MARSGQGLFITLFAMLLNPATALLGLSDAWGDSGDDAFEAYRIEDYPRAVKLAQSAAKQENYLAQFVLGRAFEEGNGAVKDKEEAAKWFRQALAQARPKALGGDPRAQHVLGRMYFFGWGIKQDAREAIVWYLKAAEQGHAPSQYNLGVTYDEGEVVPRDAKQAAAWYRKAAESGDRYAQFNLSIHYLQGDGITRDPFEAANWTRRAAMQGFPRAQRNLGAMYAQGLGVQRSDTEAMKWALRAAKQGDALAQQNLGGMYLEGKGASVNKTLGEKWLAKAAAQRKQIGPIATAMPSGKLPVGSPSANELNARIQEAIKLVRGHRNPSAPRDFRGLPTGKTVGAFLDGVVQAAQSKGLPWEINWTAKPEQAPVYHVEARTSAGYFQGSRSVTVYPFHANIESRGVTPAPDVRPTRDEKRHESALIYEDTRYLIEHMLGDAVD